MVTAAAFGADPYIRREVVTPELDWLGDEMCRRTGRPRVAAGTKGDRFHLSGGHRSQDFLVNSPLCANRSYTRQSGLTSVQARHIAAFDFTPGSDAAMVAQCKRIHAAMRAGRLDEVTAFYGNLGGDKVVDGWDNIRDRAATSDSSHLWHWHLTLDRRHCANASLMRRIVAVALGDTMEEDNDMPMTSAEKLEIAKLAAREVWALRDHPSDGVDRAMGDALWNIFEATFLRRADSSTVQDLATIKANLNLLLGKDFVNEQQVVDGVLAGLGAIDLGEAAAALRAVFGDRVAQLAALLAPPTR